MYLLFSVGEQQKQNVVHMLYTAALLPTLILSRFHSCVFAEIAMLGKMRNESFSILNKNIKAYRFYLVEVNHDLMCSYCVYLHTIRFVEWNKQQLHQLTFVIFLFFFCMLPIRNGTLFVYSISKIVDIQIGFMFDFPVLSNRIHVETMRQSETERKIDSDHCSPVPFFLFNCAKCCNRHSSKQNN